MFPIIVSIVRIPLFHFGNSELKWIKNLNEMFSIYAQHPFRHVTEKAGMGE